MRVLVTGATGFIGSKLVRALRTEGWTVRALVRPGRAAAFAPEDGIEACVGDLDDPASLQRSCRGIDAVVHTAGALGKWGVPEASLRRINVGGTAALLEASREARVRHLVHLSAGGVSGPMPPVPADETYPCRPRTPYERTKLEAERLALEFHRRHRLPLTILRPTFTYGPGDRHKLPIFRAVQKGKIVLVGSGNSLIHPVFVDDVVRGIRCALDREGTGRTYILGGPRPVSKRELLDAIAEAIGVRRRWRRIPRGLAFAAALGAEGVGRLVGKAPPLTRGRVWMMGWSFGYRIARAQAELGYDPITDLDAGLRQTVAWYRTERMLD